MVPTGDCTTLRPRPSSKATIRVSDLTDTTKMYYLATASEDLFTGFAFLDASAFYEGEYTIATTLEKRRKGRRGPRQEKRYDYLRNEACKAMEQALDAAGWTSEQVNQYPQTVTVWRKPGGVK